MKHFERLKQKGEEIRLEYRVAMEELYVKEIELHNETVSSFKELIKDKIIDLSEEELYPYNPERSDYDKVLKVGSGVIHLERDIVPIEHIRTNDLIDILKLVEIKLS